MAEQTNTHKGRTNWTDLAIGLYDRLNERNSVITYEFDDMEIDVPGSTEGTESAHWKLNGTIRISTSEKNK